MSFSVVIGFATSNPHKLRETEQCLQQIHAEIKMMPLIPRDEVEETGSTFEENARLKLEACLRGSVPPEVDYIIAEDAGLVIPALDGRYGIRPFPGIYSDRWFTSAVQAELLGQQWDSPAYIQKNQGILALMKDISHRESRYVACVACWSRQSDKITLLNGTIRLQVASVPQGEEGFGYDPIMIPVDYDASRTMAQLSAQEKNRISHRFQALSQLVGVIAQERETCQSAPF